MDMVCKCDCRINALPPTQVNMFLFGASFILVGAVQSTHVWIDETIIEVEEHRCFVFIFGHPLQ